MKDQFADYETSIMLKQLGFDEPCLMCFYGRNNVGKPKKELYLPNAFSKVKNSISDIKNKQEHLTAPLWQQVEQWLWLKYRIYFCMEEGSDNIFTCTPSRFSKEIFTMQQASDCPVIARIEGIRAVVKYFLTKN